jgi:cytochrome c oxidase subunit II
MILGKTRSSALSATFLIAALLASAVLAQTPAPAKRVRIQVTARKYAFNPDVITVNAGDRVELIITAIDRDHGIAIPAFGVKQYLKKGVPTAVSFVASKPGTFAFHCSVFCGMGHRHMKGKLVVEAK